MDFTSFVKKKDTNIRLQFYNVRPTSDLQLEKLEELAVERLKILRNVDAAGQDYIKGSSKYTQWLEAQLSKGGPLSRAMVLHTEDARDCPTRSTLGDIDDDVMSQFYLSLSYCRTDILSNWFMRQEIDLFSFRFDIEASHSPKTIERFIYQNDIKLLTASQSEIALLEEYNENITQGSSVYKVPFIEVRDLVVKRVSQIIRGYVFLVSLSDVNSIIKSRLRVNMSRMLAIMRANVSIVDQDERLHFLLANLNNRYIGKTYNLDKDTKNISAADIAPLMKSSFPPCMTQIHNLLIREHHLKHDNRLTLSLFLKGIGLPIEELLKFFSEKFQPKTDTESFNKKYTYNFRHNYGLEGKRVNYTPYSCIKVINTNAVNGCGGCPFKTMESNLLSQQLKSHPKATAERVSAIVDKVDKNQYQIGCREYFKMVHDLPSDYSLTISHPNQYFEESQKILKK